MNLFKDFVKKIEASLQEVTVQHILVPTQMDANSIYDQIIDEGANADTMARFAAARSTCGSARKKPDAMLKQLRGRPGELTFRRGQMAPKFESTAFTSPVGELVRPFQTEFGWHVMFVNERTDNSGSGS